MCQRSLQLKSKRRSKPTTVKAKRKLAPLRSRFGQKLWEASAVMYGVEAFQFTLF